MKAWVHERFGGPEVLRLEDVPKPTPNADEVLVKVLATTVTAADWRALGREVPRGFGPFAKLMFGASKPREAILGGEFAGVVESVGGDVTRFAPGDAVFGATKGASRCHAEYVTVRERGAIARKPAALTIEEAAALSFGGATALYFLERARLKAGERVLVIGAAGGVGTATVQLAKHMGAHVTGVASGANLDVVRAVGADAALDHAREDALAARDAYDIVVDTVGVATFARARPALRSGGRLLAVAGDLVALVTAPLHRGDKRAIAGVAMTSAERVARLAALAEAGALKPYIGATFEFTQMPEAHALVASRHKRGNAVVRVAPGA